MVLHSSVSETICNYQIYINDAQKHTVNIVYCFLKITRLQFITEKWKQLTHSFQKQEWKQGTK